jgi:hypothetical protein
MGPDADFRPVDVEIEPTPEALDHRYRAALAIANAAAPRATAVEREQRVHVDAEDGAAELVIPRDPVAEAIRQREDPLSYGDPGQSAVHELGGLSVHTAPAAARAEAAPLARERHEPLEGAVTTADASETAGEHAAREKLSELALHEVRKPALGARGCS